MQKVKTILLILCLSMIVALVGLYRIDIKTKFNAKASIEKVENLSNLANHKKN